MAKEFRKWNNAFSREEISQALNEWLPKTFVGSTVMSRVHFAAEIKVWSSSDIGYAVYHAPDAPEWQLFRVAMKGCTTYEKLYMLVTRRHYMLSEYEAGNIDDTKRRLEMIRIDNYIGALRRGGQLDANYEVVK